MPVEPRTIVCRNVCQPISGPTHSILLLLQRLPRKRTVKLRVQVGHSSGITGVAYLPGARQVLTASVDGTARLWDIATGSDVRTFENVFPISSMALSSKGNWLLTGGVTTRLWDVNTGQRIRAFGSAWPSGSEEIRC